MDPPAHADDAVHLREALIETWEHNNPKIRGIYKPQLRTHMPMGIGGSRKCARTTNVLTAGGEPTAEV